jgi:aminoglycoside phosphotransferase (APT) family kinase protein
MNQQDDALSNETALALLNVIAPGSSLIAVRPLAGSFSNFTHLVEFDAASGLRTRIVVRRYAIFGQCDRGEKARREFRTLELLQGNDIPAPQPLYLDQQGTLLGTPGIVTSYVPGQLVMESADPLSWARSLAVMLARIHSISCGGAAKDFLLDADSEATWFLRSGVVPAYMNAHPVGAVVWQAVHDLWPNRQAAPAMLVHIDYWSGNVLWKQGQIAAIVDWEEAACGEAGIDVAYCRMDMILGGMARAADEFLAVYEENTGRPVTNLGLWELAAAARPMFNPEGWITESPTKERFRQFVADAMKRAS